VLIAPFIWPGKESYGREVKGNSGRRGWGFNASVSWEGRRRGGIEVSRSRSSQGGSASSPHIEAGSAAAGDARRVKVAVAAVARQGRRQAGGWASAREQAEMATGPGGPDEMVGLVYSLRDKIGK
jgi:hypothetical protein